MTKRSIAPSGWLSLGTGALMWGGGWLFTAQASMPVATLQRQLKTAVCQNDWPTAIDWAGAMIASPALTAADRNDLVSFRQQLQTYQRDQVVFDYIPGCEGHLAQYLDPVPTPSQPLQLERALALLAGLSAADMISDQQAQQAMAHWQAGLLEPQPTPVPALSPARLIGTANGSGVSAGAVSSAVEVFAFVGGQGDLVTVDLNVTRILPGALYSDDDSQLYLFDSQGYLIASNDDFDGLQSRLSNLSLPSADIYYVAVTTYNNTPQLSPAGQLLGWAGAGGSAIEYTLAITGLTPSGQLALPTTVQR